MVFGRSQAVAAIVYDRCDAWVDPRRRSKPCLSIAWGEVLRLNAVTILFGALMASSFPSKVKHEAVSLTGPAPRPAAAQEAVSVPEFVSLINLSEFLLAAEDNAAVSPGAREASEVLSAKFAGPAPVSHSNTEFFHAVVQKASVTPTVLDAPVDPKSLPRVAALSEGQAVPDPGPGLAQQAVETVKPEAAAEPRKAEIANSVVRPKTRGHRHTGHIRARSAKLSLARQRGRRPTPSPTSSNATSPKKISAFDRLVGFLGLSPDPMLSH